MKTKIFEKHRSVLFYDTNGVCVHKVKLNKGDRLTAKLKTKLSSKFNAVEIVIIQNWHTKGGSFSSGWTLKRYKLFNGKFIIVRHTNCTNR